MVDPKMKNAGADLVASLFVGVVTMVVGTFMMKWVLNPNAASAKAAKHKKREIKERFGRDIQATNDYENMVLNEVLDPDQISATFDSIGGLDKIKDRLKEVVILPLIRPG